MGPKQVYFEDERLFDADSARNVFWQVLIWLRPQIFEELWETVYPRYKAVVDAHFAVAQPRFVRFEGPPVWTPPEEPVRVDYLRPDEQPGDFDWRFQVAVEYLLNNGEAKLVEAFDESMAAWQKTYLLPCTWLRERLLRGMRRRLFR